MKKLFLKKNFLLKCLIAFGWLFSIPSVSVADEQAQPVETNEVIIYRAPTWVRRVRVQKVIDRIQMKLEWATRKTKMFWYPTEESFSRAHGLGNKALAVTQFQNGEASVHFGPRVTQENFDEVLGHELVHVIIFQKYKKSIPKWLEEGLANHLAKSKPVDYVWLASQPFPKDVRELAHPFSGSSEGVFYRYKASQAFAELLEKKCDLQNLIRISLENNLEDKLVTYCEIKDLNKAFQDWVKRKANMSKS